MFGILTEKRIKIFYLIKLVNDKFRIKAKLGVEHTKKRTQKVVIKQKNGFEMNI